MKPPKILVIGAGGMLGTDLTVKLRDTYGVNQVIAADFKQYNPDLEPYVELNVLEHFDVKRVVQENKITQIYLMAAIPMSSESDQAGIAWKLHIQSLLTILELTVSEKLDRVFWPSSIAVFGRVTPEYTYGQQIVAEPVSTLGLCKKTGEYWCQYYADYYNVDVRSIRYPSVISTRTGAGKAAVDYTTDMLGAALDRSGYECFLNEDTCLPMIYLPDAVRAAIELMEAPREKLSVRAAYNISALNFSPCDLEAAIRQHVPDFNVSYKPDARQQLASDAPQRIDDQMARREWRWNHEFDLSKMTSDMLRKLSTYEPKTSMEAQQ